MSGVTGPRHALRLVEIDSGGKTIRGVMEIAAGLVIVTTKDHQLKELLDGRDPEAVAMTLLRRLYIERLSALRPTDEAQKR